MINARSLDELLPETKKKAITLIAMVESQLSKELGKNVKVQILRTYSDFAYQDALYAQGRSAKGQIVTNARGGDSWHNYRRAFDIAIKIDGTITWEKKYYQVLGGLAKLCDLVWGGDWDGDGKIDPEDWDLCHFQDSKGLRLADLKKEFANVASVG